jgi:hypothetical protein
MFPYIYACMFEMQDLRGYLLALRAGALGPQSDTDTGTGVRGLWGLPHAGCN